MLQVIVDLRRRLSDNPGLYIGLNGPSTSFAGNSCWDSLLFFGGWGGLYLVMLGDFATYF